MTEEFLNPSFENWTGGLPDNWSVEVGGACTITQATDFGYEGENSLLMTTDGTPGTCQISQTKTGLLANKKYTVGIARNMPDDNKDMKIQIKDSGSNVYLAYDDEEIYVWTSTPSWITIPKSYNEFEMWYLTFTTHISYTDYIFIFARGDAATSTTIYLDAATLYNSEDEQPEYSYPNMTDFYPTCSRPKPGKSIVVDWSAWESDQGVEMGWVHVYASAEADCTIEDANYRGSVNWPGKVFTIGNLSPNVTYSIKIRPFDTLGEAGIESENVSVDPNPSLDVLISETPPTEIGDLCIVGGTAVEIDDCDTLVNWSLATHRLAFVSGGTHEVLIGDTIKDHTTGATAVVHSIFIISGSWAGGNAYGRFWLTNLSGGTFVIGHQIDEGANEDVATADQNSIESASSVSIDSSWLKEGIGSIKILFNASAPGKGWFCLKCTMSAKDLSGCSQISFWNYIAAPAGSVASLNIYMGENKTDENQKLITNSSYYQWVSRIWDISSIPVSQKDQITLFTIAKNGEVEDTYGAIYIDFIIGKSGHSKIQIVLQEKVATIYPSDELNVESVSRFKDDFLMTLDTSRWTIALGQAIPIQGLNGVTRFRGSATEAINIYPVGQSTLFPYNSSKNPIIKIIHAQFGNVATRRFGFTDGGMADGEPTNGIYWRHTNAGNYIAVCRAAGVESSLDTGVAAAIGIFHKLRLIIYANLVEVIIDEICKGFIISNIPTANLYFSFCSSAQSSIIGMDIDCVEIIQER